MLQVDEYKIITCRQCLAHHPMIIRQLLEHKDSELARKSHYFAGRYENIYLETHLLPGIETILKAAQLAGADFLGISAEDLQLRFWFNFMEQDNVTLAHTHDVDNELLSGTYYLQVPSRSGKLLLHLQDGQCEITPVEGQFVFFDPTIEHEVTRHLHSTPRISLGFNLGYNTED